MATIFISYRRADTASETGRLYDRLVERYGRTQVFKDVDSIPAGASFPDYIVESMQASDVALVVIGPRWLNAISGFAQRRLDDPADFVRIEIETALRLGVPVVPVLVGGASLPPARRLPESLRPLLRQNGLQLRQDPDFSRDAERIFAAIDYWQAQPRRPLTPSEPAPTPTAAVLTPALSSAPERAAQPAAPPTPRPVATAVAERPAVSRGKRWALRRAPLLAAGSVLLAIAVVAAFILSQSAGGTGPSATDRQGTQTAGAQATHAVATTTADARRGLLPWSPKGGPGPCDPTERAPKDGFVYWQMDQPSAVTCEPDGKTARIGVGKSGQQIPAIHFYGLPWYYPQYNSAFPDQFTVDMDIGFTSSDPGGQYNNEYCAKLIVQLQTFNDPSTPWLEFCRDGYYSSSLSSGARHPYQLKTTNHLRLTVNADMVGVDLNGQTVLSMTPFAPPVYNLYLYMSWSSDTGAEAITVSNFVLTPITS